MEKSPIKLYRPYKLFLSLFFLCLIVSLFLSSPSELFAGYARILTSPSLLVTDYVFLGGLPAAVWNASTVGLLSTAVMIFSRVKPNGATIMGIFLNFGFAFFGKNILNMLPLLLGVWLYAKKRREPFLHYSLVALLSSTVAPIVSEVAFGGFLSPWLDAVFAVLLGLFVGFIMPVVSAASVRVHEGYNLYNIGFAGGLITMVFYLFAKGFGIPVTPGQDINYDHSSRLAVFLYAISVVLIVFGLVFGKKNDRKHLKRLLKSSGRAVSDYYLLHGDSIFLNMGVLCALATTAMLLLGVSISGPVVGGILTITGFGCFGKHPRNVFPVMAGAIVSAAFNVYDFHGMPNVLAILFSTGLAPIAGQFGAPWGFVAGFLHVAVATQIGVINGGLNLYNNGFTAGFIALLLAPLIATLRNEPKKERL
ncbi:DUF1576 domain-containing protein [Oscillospiraceae bacterium OttesenSCG-928-G22]|nr:DUF1576 domain-containing protein [Oscillospiraceae bacterium OttesenSCG-928-G22]